MEQTGRGWSSAGAAAQSKARQSQQPGWETRERAQSFGRLLRLSWPSRTDSPALARPNPHHERPTLLSYPHPALLLPGQMYEVPGMVMLVLASPVGAVQLRVSSG